MKFHALTYAVALAATVGLTGCVSPDGTQNTTAASTATGALVGSAVGALAGATLGNYHNAGDNALIGAAAGAAFGGLVGFAADQQQKAYLQAQAPQTYTRVEQRAPLGVADVEHLAKAGCSDQFIIEQIYQSRTVYHLNAAEIIGLRDAGVSNPVINYMINTPSTVGATAETTRITTTYIQQAPPPPPAETLVVAPGPGYVWIGGEWVWNGGWFWVGAHWAYPPYPHAVWVSGRCWHDDHGWHNTRGHWH